MIKSKRILVILTLIIASCQSVHYIYKSGFAVTEAELRAHPHVGLAIYGENILCIHNQLRKDVSEFSETPLSITYVTNETALTPDRESITNVEALKEKHPRMRYVIAVWQYDPVIEYEKRWVEETKSYEDEDGNWHTEIEDEYWEYETTLSIHCEFILYDLNYKMLVAKSIDEFSQTETREVRKESFSFDGTANIVASVFKLLSTSDESLSEEDRYPDIRSLDAGKLDDYCYHFLEGLSE